MTAVEDEFIMEGDLDNEGIANMTFNNLNVYLYYANGTRIKKHHMGDLSTTVPVTIRSTQIPDYVIIDSPDFWSTSKVEVAYYEKRKSGNYTESIVTERDDLPVNPRHRNIKYRPW
ncbi:hypothetical protein [Haloarcula sebkhae]|nr:hypothetical protein [Haloarcula sebkhae]